MRKMSLQIHKCPFCGGECEKYDEEFFLCTKCGKMSFGSDDDETVEISDPVVLVAIRAEIERRCNGKVPKDMEEDVLRAYARMSESEREEFIDSITD